MKQRKKKKKTKWVVMLKLLELQLHWFSKYSGQEHRTKEWLKYSGREVLMVKSGRMQEKEKHTEGLTKFSREATKIRQDQRLPA